MDALTSLLVSQQLKVSDSKQDPFLEGFAVIGTSGLLLFGFTKKLKYYFKYFYTRSLGHEIKGTWLRKP